MKAIDIIIVNYNSAECTTKAIDSLKKYCNGYHLNIIVVDNNSIESIKDIEHRNPDIKLLVNDQNLGFSKAINQGFKKANSEYVVILNPDTVILAGFFDKLIDYLETHKNIGVIGPRILDGNGAIQGSARRFPTFWTSIFGRKSPLTKLFPNNKFTKNEFICFSVKEDENVEVDWVSGACMIIRRTTFEAVGGFDERFFMYWEDTDLCRRIRNKGWKIIYYTRAKVVHYIGKSSSSRPIRSIFHFHNSCFKLFKKHAVGFQISIIPIAFIALSFRCFFVVLWKIAIRSISH